MSVLLYTASELLKQSIDQHLSDFIFHSSLFFDLLKKEKQTTLFLFFKQDVLLLDHFEACVVFENSLHKNWTDVKTINMK